MKVPESLMRIDPAGLPGIGRKPVQEKRSGEIRFSDQVKEIMQAVNEKQAAATEKVDEVVMGKSDDLHNAMVALEEANVSFHLMLEVRNKMLEAYQEINRMNI